MRLSWRPLFGGESHYRLRVVFGEHPGRNFRQTFNELNPRL